MSGNRSRRKGADGEREAARTLSREWNVPLLRSAMQARGPHVDGPDLVGVEPCGIEVSRAPSVSARSLYRKLRQATDQTNGPPLLVHRRDHELWLATCWADELPSVGLCVLGAMMPPKDPLLDEVRRAATRYLARLDEERSR